MWDESYWFYRTAIINIQPKVIVLRTPSDWVAYEVRSDCVRCPIGRRTENDDFWLNNTHLRANKNVPRP